MQRPAVATVIVGATSAQQLEANIASLELQPDAELLRELDSLSDPLRHGEPFAVYRLT
ncbi:hypothetical protein D3C84_1245470 [compost metagenome]